MKLDELGLEIADTKKLEQLISTISREWAPEMVVLVGSYATGRYVRKASDIDLLVIADNLASRYFERLRGFDHTLPIGLPVEILAYTPAEFSVMLSEAHPTAIDAIEFGKALRGQENFASYRTRLESMYDQGLTRTNVSLRLPPREAS